MKGGLHDDEAYADVFLPGVPADKCLEALAAAGGDEISSGKLFNPESSAALAVNTFGWFLRQPEALPPFPCLAELDWPATSVELERQMRFPWHGGRHPWLDAAVETGTCLIGVESKRFEPFRDAKLARLSVAYDRPVWGPHMRPFEAMRDRLRRANDFRFLDAAQLVKHAFGLVSEAERVGKKPVLLYLFAEPATRSSKPISEDEHKAHRAEVSQFADAVEGAEVRFVFCSYRDWLDTWKGTAAGHGHAILAHFEP